MHCRTVKNDLNLSIEERSNKNVTLTESFMQNGAANYPGIYWPVEDNAAADFSETFYKNLVLGALIGKALQNRRNEVCKIKPLNWADYVHHGSYGFVRNY